MSRKSVRSPGILKQNRYGTPHHTTQHTTIPEAGFFCERTSVRIPQRWKLRIFSVLVDGCCFQNVAVHTVLETRITPAISIGQKQNGSSHRLNLNHRKNQNRCKINNLKI